MLGTKRLDLRGFTLVEELPRSRSSPRSSPSPFRWSRRHGRRPGGFDAASRQRECALGGGSVRYFKYTISLAV